MLSLIFSKQYLVRCFHAVESNTVYQKVITEPINLGVAFTIVSLPDFSDFISFPVFSHLGVQCWWPHISWSSSLSFHFSSLIQKNVCLQIQIYTLYIYETKISHTVGPNSTLCHLAVRVTVWSVFTCFLRRLPEKCPAARALLSWCQLPWSLLRLDCDILQPLPVLHPSCLLTSKTRQAVLALGSPSFLAGSSHDHTPLLNHFPHHSPSSWVSHLLTLLAALQILTGVVLSLLCHTQSALCLSWSWVLLFTHPSAAAINPGGSEHFPEFIPSAQVWGMKLLFSFFSPYT